MQIWISPELSERMDRARDLIPIQRWVTRLIENAVAQDEAERRSTAGELRKRHQPLAPDSLSVAPSKHDPLTREEEGF